MRVYVQATVQGEARYSQMMQTEYFFWERGYDVIRFTLDELASGKLDEDLLGDMEHTIVFGAVAAVRLAIQRAGRPLPPNIDFPLSIRHWAGRRVWDTTMGEIRRLVDSDVDLLPIHVKPRDHHKLFKGAVIESFRDLIPSSGVSNDEPCLAQEVVEFVSEWRASILRGKIINVAHYKGDPLRFPDPQVLQAALNEYTGCPLGFGMDWGVVADGRTLLVEVNDGFSLGNYGVRGHLYTALVEVRWRELMGLEDNGVGM